MEASASGMRNRLARPSPSKSTAILSQASGMNCVWPMAPAQEPTISRGSAQPRSTMVSAFRSSPSQ